MFQGRSPSYLDLPTGHWPQSTRPAELARLVLARIDCGSEWTRRELVPAVLRHVYCGMVATQVIVLNGGSSSGKSGIARCLQAVLPGPWLTFGVDTLIQAMPASLKTSPAGIEFAPDGAVTVGPEFRTLEAAWVQGLTAIAHAGARLIIDEVFLGGAASQRRWQAALDGLPTLWVAVRCDSGVAAGREVARGDRFTGMAVSQAELVHQGVVYDLEVDNHAHRGAGLRAGHRRPGRVTAARLYRNDRATCRQVSAMAADLHGLSAGGRPCRGLPAGLAVLAGCTNHQDRQPFRLVEPRGLEPQARALGAIGAGRPPDLCKPANVSRRLPPLFTLGCTENVLVDHAKVRP